MDKLVATLLSTFTLSPFAHPPSSSTPLQTLTSILTSPLSPEDGPTSLYALKSKQNLLMALLPSLLYPPIKHLLDFNVQEASLAVDKFGNQLSASERLLRFRVSLQSARDFSFVVCQAARYLVNHLKELDLEDDDIFDEEEDTKFDLLKEMSSSTPFTIDLDSLNTSRTLGVGGWVRAVGSLEQWEAVIAEQERLEQGPRSNMMVGLGGVSMASTTTVRPGTKKASKTDDDASSITSSSLNAILAQHSLNLSFIIHFLYTHGRGEYRAALRSSLGSTLLNLSKRANKAPTNTHVQSFNWGGAGVLRSTNVVAIKPLLKVLNSIVKGFTTPLNSIHLSLLTDVLLPLHEPMGYSLFRDQTSAMAPYHESLTSCIMHYVSLGKGHKVGEIGDTNVVLLIVSHLIGQEVWPGGNRSNTDKEVLLLEELEYVLVEGYSGTHSALAHCERQEHDYTDYTDYRALEAGLLRIIQCVTSENSRVAERALQMWKNEVLSQIITAFVMTQPDVLKILVKALGRGLKPSWNPTVNKMSGLVLEKLEAAHCEVFVRVAEQLYGSRAKNGRALDAKTVSALDENGEDEEEGKDSFSAEHKSSCEGKESSIDDEDCNSVASDEDTAAQVNRVSFNNDRASVFTPTITASQVSIKSQMQSWSGGGNQSGGQPPSTITGVAPWATKQSGHQPKVMGVQTMMPPPTSHVPRGQPPVTITGVAPWAMQTTRPHPSKVPGSNMIFPGKSKIPVPAAVLKKLQGRVRPDLSANSSSSPSSSGSDQSGIDLLHQHMTLIKPSSEDNDQFSPWVRAQLAASPTLLPTLKFHDLVFGKDLGSGAFSTVKYARQIKREQSRSKWPEYAVKVISTSMIREMGYEGNVNREIAALRCLSHPGIARLISSFRFRDGAYLVLEYASKGDLHTLISRNGSLDETSAQFVIGEVIVAIQSVHEQGFIYGDLKPENIMITEAGHIKVGDFGGCRAWSQVGKDVLSVSMDVVKSLRSGDWKPEEETKGEDDGGGWGKEREETDDFMVENGKVEDDDMEDFRIEGTAAYLPPEVINGAYPNQYADVWALGCVLFYCIAGKPPIIDLDNDKTMRKIVQFSKDHSVDFFGRHGDAFSEECQDVVRSCCKRDWEGRPSMLEVGKGKWFKGVELGGLFDGEAVELNIGSVKEGEVDEQWTRRQHSMIWAPQVSYDIAANSSSSSGDGGRRVAGSLESIMRKGIEELRGEFNAPFSNAVRGRPLMNMPGILE